MAGKYLVMGRGNPTIYEVVRAHDLAVCSYSAGYHFRDNAPRRWGRAVEAQAFAASLDDGRTVDDVGCSILWITEPRQ